MAIDISYIVKWTYLLLHQLLDYKIVVVEQTHVKAFNRAKLFNVGFLESKVSIVFVNRQNILRIVLLIRMAYFVQGIQGTYLYVDFFQALHGHTHCLVFHDVDLIPLDGRNLYACASEPRHLSSNLDEFRFGH